MIEIARSGHMIFCAILCAMAPLASGAPNYVDPDLRATEQIRRLVQAGNCKGAIEDIKSGVKSKQADVLLLAGTFYEEGVCVTPNWEKAANLYMLADEAGNKSAITRLIAGYARSGRDNGLALWWIARSSMRQNFPAECIPRSNPNTDADGFNKELEKMPATVFQGCVYTVGVVSELHAQGLYPKIAAYYGMTGKVTMEFSPAAGTINWSQDSLGFDDGQPRGVRDLAKVELENPRIVKNSLLEYLKGKGEFALSRYQRPDTGIDPAFVFKTQFIFRMSSQ